MLRVASTSDDRVACRPATTFSVCVAATVLLLLAGCSGSSDGSTPETPAPSADTPEVDDAIAVKVQEVQREPLSSIYSTSATLRADKQATVTARTRGVIRRLAVEEGDRVTEGQVLVHLEDEEQIIELDRAATARDTRLREYDRAKALHVQGLMSDEEYETARRESDDAKQAMALAQLNLSRTVIRSPFAGTVLRRHLDVGNNVSDGTPVYDLADLDPLFADVNVPERQLSRLAPRQVVRLTADASGVTAEARIERIAPAVDPSTGTVKVTLALLGRSGFRPGGFVRVAIVTDTHDQALVVPRSALVAEGRRWHVFRVENDEGEVSRIEVGRGFEEGDRVEVLAPGTGEEPVRPGDLVVVVGASALNDKSKIRIMDPSGDPADEQGESAATSEGDRVAS